ACCTDARLAPVATCPLTERTTSFASVMARSAMMSRTTMASGTTKATSTIAVTMVTSSASRRRISRAPARRAPPARPPPPPPPPPHRMQVPGLLRGLAKLAAQPRQVHVEALVGAAIGELPDLDEQLLLGDHGPGPGRKVVQQIELAWRQVKHRTVEEGLASAPVDAKPAHLDHRVLGGLPGPAQHRPDPGVELRTPVRFHDVVGGP